MVDSGFTKEQAETQTKIIGNVLSLVSKSQVNKQDIHLLEERLKRKFEEKNHELGAKIMQIESRLESKMMQIESRLIKMLFTAFGATTSILALLMTYLH